MRATCGARRLTSTFASTSALGGVGGGVVVTGTAASEGRDGGLDSALDAASATRAAGR